MTPTDYNNLIAQVLTRQTNPFFAGAKDHPNTLVNSRTELDLRKLWQLTGVTNMNPLECLRECTGTDGKVYAQPVSEVSERVTAGYLSTDFAFDRFPFTERALPFDTTDFMPILNLWLWPIKDELVLRYNRSKQIARPPASRLTGSSVVCTNDYTDIDGAEDDDGGTMNCSGVIGNPALRPQTNLNQNLSLEWYPNRDTVLGASTFVSKGIVGAARRSA